MEINFEFRESSTGVVFSSSISSASITHDDKYSKVMYKIIEILLRVDVNLRPTISEAYSF